MAEKSNVTEFINKATLIHGDKYDYSSVEYINNSIKVIIICFEHGEFYTTPGNHTNSKLGCPICRKNYLRYKRFNSFLNKANLIHKNKYNYSLVNYINNSTKIEITCPIHGSFMQTPNGHLNNSGCSKCSGYLIKNTNEFIKNSSKLHKNKYNYSLVDYKTCSDKVEIICPIHGKFLQVALTHSQGSGCPICGLIGHTKTEWINFCKNKSNSDPKVYIIKCYNNNEKFYKIGITSNTVKRRFDNHKSMPYSYEIIKEIKGSPAFVWDKEKDLHRKYKSFKYKPLIHFDGITECFSIDIIF